MPFQRNHYEIFGLEPSATQEEIRLRFLELVRRHHPDRCRNKVSAQRIFTQINIACKTLRDPELRAEYDKTVKAPKSPSVVLSPAQNDPGGVAAQSRAASAAPPPPSDPDEIFTLAESAYWRGESKEARRLCDEIIKLLPNEPNAQRLLGDILADQGMYEPALAAYKIAYSEFSQSHLFRAKVEQIEIALSAAKKAGSSDVSTSATASSIPKRSHPSDPADPSARHARNQAAGASRLSFASPDEALDVADSAYLRGDIEEAERLCGEVIKLLPNMPRAHRLLGDILAQEGKYEEALKSYRLAHSDYAKSPLFHAKMEQAERAVMAAKKAQAPKPSVEPPAAKPAPPKIDSAPRAAVPPNPDGGARENRHESDAPRADASLRDRLGFAEKTLWRGDLKEAQRLCDEIIKLSPKEPSAHQLLGDIFVSEGKYEEALAAYRIALVAFSKSQLLRANIERAEQALAAARKVPSPPPPVVPKSQPASIKSDPKSIFRHIKAKRPSNAGFRRSAN